MKLAEAIKWLSSLLLVSSAAHADLAFQEEVIAPSVAAWGKGLGDLDGDGNDDVVLAGGDLGSNVLWRAAPDWSEHSIGTMGGGDDLQIADINGDGAYDVVVNGGPLVWYENPRGTGGDPTEEWMAHTVPDTDKAHDLVVGDVDGDGQPDILTRVEFGSTSLFLQNDGAWTRIDLPNAPDGEGSALCDVDDDGLVDVVGNGYWLPQPADAVAGTWEHHLIGDSPEGASAACADINADGRLDVVLAASEVGLGRLSWFEAPSDPRAEAWTRHDIDNAEDVHRLHVVDMDADGDLDIVFGEMHQSATKFVGVQLNNGDATFTREVISTEGTHNIAIGDVDADGDLDLLGANWNTSAPDEGALKLWRNLSNSVACARETFDVLVFSRTLEFRHTSIPTGIAALREWGESAGFDVVDTEDPAIFTDDGLAPFEVIVFLSPSGEVLDAAQQEAFQSFINDGGGFVGIHNPTAYVLEDWDWYTGLVATRFESELEGNMRLETVDKDHPSTAELPDEWTFEGEAYNFLPNPKENGVTVLINLDENSVAGGTMGADHPISWYHLYDGGRAFYTVLGADDDDYTVPEFRTHVVGAIQWAADVATDPGCADDGAGGTPGTGSTADAGEAGAMNGDAAMGSGGSAGTGTGSDDSGMTRSAGAGGRTEDGASGATSSTGDDDVDSGSARAEAGGSGRGTDGGLISAGAANDDGCACRLVARRWSSSPQLAALLLIGCVVFRRRGRGSDKSARG